MLQAWHWPQDAAVVLQQTPSTHGPAEQSAVDSTGAPIPGRVTSRLNDTLDELLRASLAVHVTVWWPTENRLPDAGVQVTAAGPLIQSVAVGGVYGTVTPPASGASTLMLWTGEKTGPILSKTVTVNEALRRCRADRPRCR